MFLNSPIRHLFQSVRKGLLVRVACFLFLVSGSSAVSAQESMIPELSYPFLEKLIFTARENYPRMKANQHRVRFAELNLKKNKLSWFDFFSLSAFYSPSTSVTLTNATLTGVQIGLFINFSSIIQKPTMIKQSREELAIAKYTYDEMGLSVENMVKERYFKYIQYMTVLKLRSQAVIDAEALYKQIKFKFERGEDTFENYSKSLIQFVDNKQRLVETEGMLLISKSNLEEMIGKKLEEVK
ncbi:MAG: TolC family protein [Sediminibacterium sp.]|nr:TolC family protein [Sediminibacterium sp.]